LIKIKKIHKDISWLFINQLMSYLIPLFLFPFLARKLGPSGFGLIMFSQSFALILAFFIEYGFYVSAQREAANINNRKSLQAILSSVTTAKLILSIIVTCGFFAIAFFTPKFNHNYLLIFLSLALGNVLGFSLTWFLRGIGHHILSSSLDILMKLLALFLCIYFIRGPGDEWKYLFSLFISQLAFLGYSFFYLHKRFPFHALSFGEGLDRLKSGYKMFCSHFLGAFLTLGNPFLLGLFLPIHDVGLFSAAEKIARVSVSVLEPLKISFFPRFSSFVGRSPQRAKFFIHFAAIKFIAIGFSISLILFFLSDFSIKTIFGDAFIEAISILKIISFFPFFYAIDSAYSFFWILPRHKESSTIKILLSANILNFLSLVLFAKILGPKIMAWNMLIIQCLIAFSFLLIVRKDIFMLNSRS
jgi:PST family polysaccharide transporter